MAAKVAAVAVPAVLGIASIRIYTVKEEPTDGLIPRERLNIYTPLARSAQAPVAPERPGFIQSGITTARESIQPLVQASKDAYLSVKTGSVKLYHTLEDVYYYLKDPPPEFLPRFGTITMAGLLGMFLARKGSRFKRTVVPLGLMGAAASVCYPAQAVAVVKVTGKKVYGAGQWSGAAVSSLFVSKPQEAVGKDPTSAQPQAEEVAVVESAGSQEASEVHSTEDKSDENPTVPQTEAATPESAPGSNQPGSAVISEELSSVTLAEIPPSQTPAHAGPSGEEPPETKRASFQPMPEVSTPTLQPAQADYAEAAPAKAASMASEPSVPVVVAVRPHEAATEETAAEHRDGSGFKADPALMDFGQSSPEDEDLYSTRS